MWQWCCLLQLFLITPKHLLVQLFFTWKIFYVTHLTNLTHHLLHPAPLIRLMANTKLCDWKLSAINGEEYNMRWINLYTFRACSRSSRVCAADIQTRVLASSKGVAGNATTTTATWIQRHNIMSLNIHFRKFHDWISERCSTPTLGKRLDTTRQQENPFQVVAKNCIVVSYASTYVRTWNLTLRLRHSREKAGIFPGL